MTEITDISELRPGSTYKMRLKDGFANDIEFLFIEPVGWNGIKVKIWATKQIIDFPNVMDKFKIMTQLAPFNPSSLNSDRYIPWMGGSRRRACGGRKRKTRCKKSSKRRCRKSSRRRR